MKFMRKSLGSNWADYKVNIEVLIECKICLAIEKKKYINRTGQNM
jgi:hypothetical protein